MSVGKNIAITGAGLVGSLLSIYLAKRGYNVSVYERRPDMRERATDAGRSINLALSQRGIRALHEVGLADTLRQNAIAMHGRMMHDIRGQLSYQPYGKEGQYINSISRSGLNKVLMTEAEKLGVKFYFEHRCTSVDLQTTTLHLQLSQKGTTSQVSKKFDVIIGSDGAFSAVRSAMQVTDRFDYSQHYIEHGYKELHIPSDTNGGFRLEKNALHIWPRESFMMIALPNPDGTFTCTLFLPFEGPVSFGALRNDQAIMDFFSTHFPDALSLMPDLLKDYHTNPTSSLVTVKCYPWVRHRTLLIGDAAHAIVPFFGQGMNAGFEDCRVLNTCLDDYRDDWDEVLPLFQQQRKPNADAIAQLALDNFIEMRDLVADPEFLLRKKIEAKLNNLYPDRWIPQYSMVTFSDNIPYAQAYAEGQRQKKIMDEVMRTPRIHENWEQLDFQHIVSQLTS